MKVYDTVIVRYGEIALKSDRVRSRMENILVNSIKTVLRRKRIDIEK
ncbi:MAG: hypothetical protein ACTSXJ_05305 [Candidatus Baldrarchaeia archaeon]